MPLQTGWTMSNLMPSILAFPHRGENLMRFTEDAERARFRREREYLEHCRDTGIAFEKVVDALVTAGGEFAISRHSEWLSAQYAKAIPNAACVHAIAEHSYTSPIIEVGAGTGYWAYRIKQAGGNIKAYAAELPSRTWVPICKAWHDEIAIPCEQTLLLCCPDVETNWAFECLSRNQPEMLIYIGKGKGGDANAAFHERLKHPSDDLDGAEGIGLPGALKYFYVEVASLTLPQCPGFQATYKLYQHEAAYSVNAAFARLKGK